MNSPLRLYLMSRSKGPDWKMFVSEWVEDTVEAWMQKVGDEGISGVLHLGFGPPAARDFDEVASDHVGRLLVTQGAKFVLPEPFKCSKVKVADVGGLPVFLALEGWGYCIDDPTAGSDGGHAEKASLSNSNNSTRAPVASSWVSQFLSVAAELTETLEQAGVHDEESYLEREGLLHGSLRTALGQFRHDHLIRDPSNPLDIVRCAPPWLRSVEFERLSLTVRLENIFSRNQIKIVSDLDKYSEVSLFRLQNFGKTSNAHLVEALQDGLRRGATALHMPLDFNGEGIDSLEANGGLGGGTNGPPASISLGLIGNLLKSLSEILERDRNILLGRMGFSGPPRTLEDLAGEYQVSRQRIQQIEKQALKDISTRELWDDVMRHRLSAILDSRKDPLPLFGLEVLDDWFRGTASKEDMVAYLVDTVCEKRFYTIRIGSVRYVTRLDQETWNGKLREARQLLESAVDLNWTEADCMQAIGTFLPNLGKELAPILWSEASKLCHFSGSDEARTLTAYGRGTEQLVQVVLEDSPRPLHTSEIAHFIREISGTAIGESQVRNPVANVGFLLGRGIYGLRKHVPLSDSEIEAVAEKASEIVAEHADGRQWHASELVSELLEIDGSLSGRLDKYGLNVALQLKSRLKYLGRFVWALPDVDGQLRLDLREAILGVLESAGRPLTTNEISERLSEFRGVNSSFQIWSRDPLIRIGRGLWGLNDRDVPIKRDQQSALIEKVFNALRQKGSGIHLQEVDQFIDYQDFMDPEVILSLVSLDERIAISIGRFAYLREWEGPRRITLMDALERLGKQVSGPMNINDIKDSLEFTVEREISKAAIYNALSSSGTQYLGDGIWELKERLSGDENDELC